MNIDLIAAEQAIAEFKQKLELIGPSCIEVVLWNHRGGRRELSVRISIFDKNDTCQQGSASTWEMALDKVGAQLLPASIDPGEQPIEVTCVL